MTREEIIELIDANVYENNNKEITGANLNMVLKAMLENSGGGGKRYVTATDWVFPVWPDEEMAGEVFSTTEEMSEYCGIPVEDIEALLNNELEADLEFDFSDDGGEVPYISKEYCPLVRYDYFGSDDSIEVAWNQWYIDTNNENYVEHKYLIETVYIIGRGWDVESEDWVYGIMTQIFASELQSPGELN